MVEQNSIELEPTKAVIKNKKKKRFCRQCGNLKQNICFDHHQLPKRYTNRRIRDVVPMRLRYYLRKFYFTFATKLGLATNKKKLSNNY